jgi:hypothetical protein
MMAAARMEAGSGGMHMHPVRWQVGAVIRAGQGSDQGRTEHHQGPTLATPRHTNAPRPNSRPCSKVPTRHPVETARGLETQGEGCAYCGPIGATR